MSVRKISGRKVPKQWKLFLRKLRKLFEKKFLISGAAWTAIAIGIEMLIVKFVVLHSLPITLTTAAIISFASITLLGRDLTTLPYRLAEKLSTKAMEIAVHIYNNLPKQKLLSYIDYSLKELNIQINEKQKLMNLILVCIALLLSALVVTLAISYKNYRQLKSRGITQKFLQYLFRKTKSQGWGTKIALAVIFIGLFALYVALYLTQKDIETKRIIAKEIRKIRNEIRQQNQIKVALNAKKYEEKIIQLMRKA
jgi:uncharacterized PurR-regulated membrane protein YhhQ (DUF165 family)